MTRVWPRLLLGALCAGVGVVLTLRPFTSLAILVVLVAATFLASGVSEIVAAPDRSVSWLAGAAGLASIAAGILVLAWPGITIHALAVVAGISLTLGGLTRAVRAIRGQCADRVLAGLTGVASLSFGILALSWPDMTVLALSLLVGPSAVIFGLGQLWAAWAAWPANTGGGRTWTPPTWVRITAALAAVAAALALLALSALIHRSSPSPDAFYRASSPVPSTPGLLLRSEPYTKDIPDRWRAWRILYTTTRQDGVPALASGVVIAAKHLPAGPRPVLSWAHGTVGVASKCAPSLLQSRWNADIIPGLDQVIGRGWVIVATDYVGLGTAGPHPYLIGQGEARSVLDAVRAARHIRQLSLERSTVIWGHSQGGHAAMWAGALAPSYAPDVEVAGVAALAPASDLRALVEEVRSTLEGRLLSAYILAAYSSIYPDVSFDHYVRPAARVIVREAAGRCLDIPDAIPSAVTAVLSRQALYASDPLSGALGRRLAENTPTGMVHAPLLIAQGLSDPLVRPGIQEHFVNQRCEAGQSLEYRTYRRRDHLSLLWPGSPLVPYLLAWTEARFAGRAAGGGCSTAQR